MEKSHCVEPVGTPRPMPLYPCRLRRGSCGIPGPALSGTAAPFGIDTVAGTPSKRGGAQIEAQVEQQQQRHQAVEHPLLAAVDCKSVQAAI
jgi:hypothetical protein